MSHNYEVVVSVLVIPLGRAKCSKGVQMLWVDWSVHVALLLVSKFLPVGFQLTRALAHSWKSKIIAALLGCAITASHVTLAVLDPTQPVDVACCDAS